MPLDHGPASPPIRDRHRPVAGLRRFGVSPAIDDLRSAGGPRQRTGTAFELHRGCQPHHARQAHPPSAHRVRSPVTGAEIFSRDPGSVGADFPAERGIRSAAVIGDSGQRAECAGRGRRPGCPPRHRRSLRTSHGIADNCLLPAARGARSRPGETRGNPRFAVQARLMRACQDGRSACGSGRPVLRRV